MAASMMLPTYQRYVKGVPVSSKGKGMRLREKYVAGIVFFSFVTLCFGAFFYLPELRSVDDLRKGIRVVGRELFFPQIGVVDVVHKMKNTPNTTRELVAKLSAEIENNQPIQVAEVGKKEEPLKPVENVPAQKQEQPPAGYSEDALARQRKVKEVVLLIRNINTNIFAIDVTSI
jgi:hypothetical protein